MKKLFLTVLSAVAAVTSAFADVTYERVAIGAYYYVNAGKEPLNIVVYTTPAVESELNFSFDDVNLTATVIPGTEDYAGDIVIPATVEHSGKTYTVTAIGTNAFYNCAGLISVTIPESVTEIGWYAFSGCRGLTSVVIPASVTSIGNSAFMKCNSLESMQINGARVIYIESIGVNCVFCVPASVIDEYRAQFPEKNFVTDLKDATTLKFSFDDESQTATVISNFLKYTGNIVIPSTVEHSERSYVVTKIEEKAFACCRNLTSVSIPETVTSIGNMAFYDCESLVSVNIPNSVAYIGDEAFQYCAMTSVNIPKSVTFIGTRAFSGCKALTTADIHAPVHSLADDIFYCCDNLTSVTIPESVTSIGAEAFFGCRNLSSITIPNSVTLIDRAAFYGCSGLSSIRIPNSVTSIVGTAFYNCSGLTSVTIPESVTSIGKYAFLDCSGLESMRIKGDRVIDPDMSEISNSCIFYVPASVIEEYRAQFPEKTFVVDEEDLPANFRLAGEEPVIGLEDAVTLTLSLGNADQINGFQTDISLPAGLSVAQNSRGRLNVTFGEGTALQSHALAAQKVAGDNRYRIIAYSSLGEAFASGDGLFRILLKSDETFAGGEILIDSTELTFTDDHTEKPAEVRIPVSLLLYGDANDNGHLAIDDAVTQVHHILENNPLPFHFKKADVNRDGSVTVTDVSKTVNLVLAASAATPSTRTVATARAARSESAPMSLGDVDFVSGNATMTISLGDVDDITALQGDLILPEGVTLRSITLAAAQEDRDHRVDYLEHTPSLVRFAVYSLTLDTLVPDAPLLDVELNCTHAFAGGRIALDGIMLTDSQAKAKEYGEIATTVPAPTVPTAIETITAGSDRVDVYNLQGMPVMRNASREDLRSLAPGFYIIGGVKVIIR